MVTLGKSASLCFKYSIRSRSSSTSDIEGQRLTKCSVIAAIPGPISMRLSSGIGLMADTICPITCWSIRKFCPKRLRGLCGVFIVHHSSVAQPFARRSLGRPQSCPCRRCLCRLDQARYRDLQRF